MSDVLTQRCDECGILKKESNGWFHAVTISGCWIVAPIHIELPGERGARQHLCSESCAIKSMSKALRKEIA